MAPFESHVAASADSYAVALSVVFIIESACTARGYFSALSYIDFAYPAYAHGFFMRNSD